MGHWRHQHIVKGIALGTLGALFGFFVLAVLGAGRARTRRFGFGARRSGGPASDPAAGALGGLLVAPVQNAISRAFEREADAMRCSCSDTQVFIEAERRLARDNISNVAPSDLNVLPVRDTPAYARAHRSSGALRR